MHQQEQQIYQESQQFSAEPKVLSNKQKYREPSAPVQKHTEPREEVEYESMADGENQQEVQLDFYLDEAPQPIFVPREKGHDKSSQIEKHDLFDYDLEVEPVIEILIARCVEASRMELIEADEAEELGQQRKAFLQKRNAELMKCQRMGNRQDRKDQERERRKLQFDEQIKSGVSRQQMQLIEVVTRQQLERSIRHQVTLLDQAGVIKDSLEQKLQNEYYGELLDEVNQLLGVTTDIHKQVDSSYRGIQMKSNRAHAGAILQENERRAAIIQDRENKAFLKDYRKEIKRQKAAQTATQEDRALLYSQVLGHMMTKRQNIDHSSLLEANLLDFQQANLMTEKGVPLLNHVLLEVLVHLDLVETVLQKPLLPLQLNGVLKAFLSRLRSPPVLSTSLDMLAELTQDIQLNEEGNADFQANRAERLQYYLDNASQFSILPASSWAHTGKDLSTQAEHVIKALLDILLEQKKPEEGNQNNSTSRIEKGKPKSLVSLKASEEEEPESLPPVQFWVNIQPVRDFKQEDSMNDTSKNDISARDVNKSVNKSVNRSINKSLNKSKEKEREKELREQEEKLLAEQLAIQQEQQAKQVERQKAEQELLEKEREALQAEPDSFEHNQALIDWHAAKIRRQFLYGQNDRFSDIEYYDGQSYEKKCGQVPEQKVSSWQTMNTQMVQLGEARMVVVDNRAPVVIQQQLAVLVGETVPDFNPKEQADLLDLYRPVYNQMLAHSLAQMTPQVIFDYDE